MDSTQFILLSAATLVGGIVGSFGINLLVQRSRVRAFVERWRWWGVALYYLLIGASVVGGFAWMIRTAMANTEDVSALGSPGIFFTFGFLVGLPFTLPTITTTWRGVRGKGRARQRTKPATKQERATFANDLEKQIRELADDRDVRLLLEGDEGEILVFAGDFSRQEGERLVAALRRDLVDLSVKRVEGGPTERRWWVRVEQPSTGAKKKKVKAR